MAFDRQPVDAGELHDAARCEPATATATFLARISPRVVGDADDAVAVAQEAGHLAILDDVDAAPVGAARIAPGHRIVAGRAGARLQQAADDRKARRAGDVEAGHQPGDLVRRTAARRRRRRWRMALPRRDIVVELGRRMREIEDAALREHDVVVEIVGEVLPQLHRMLVEADVVRQQVVGAHDGRVAADIAGAEPALLQHGDVGDAMLLGEIVGGGQARGRRRR